MFCFEAVFWSLVTKLVLSIWSSGLQWKNKYSTQTQLSNLPDLYQWCPLAMEFNETSSIKYKNIIITQVFLFINHTLGPPLLYSRPGGLLKSFTIGSLILSGINSVTSDHREGEALIQINLQRAKTSHPLHMKTFWIPRPTFSRNL